VSTMHDDTGRVEVGVVGIHPEWTAARLIRLAHLAAGDALYLATCPRLTYAPSGFTRRDWSSRPGPKGPRQRGTCRHCGGDVARTAAGAASVHGPIGNRCPGSFAKVEEQP
jgi:hypothetical protein